MEYLHEEETERIIKCFYEVNNSLGHGFLEKVYQKSMLIELKKEGFICESEKPMSVYYKGEIVGEFYADIVVNDKIILELKAVDKLAKSHEYQLINYLRAGKMEIGLLLNFGENAEIRRKIYTNDRKIHLSESV